MNATFREYRRWRAAYVWRRNVERVLVGSGLTFAEWAALQALESLVAETGDAVSQSDIAGRLKLTRGTISGIMRALSDRGLIDWGCSASGPAFRILVCDEAARLLAAARASIEAISKASEKANRLRDR